MLIASPFYRGEYANFTKKQNNVEAFVNFHICPSASWLNSQPQHVNIRVGLCWLIEYVTETFWLTGRDSGTKPLNRDCPS